VTPNEAYEEIARLGREHGLIAQAAGGTIVIVHHETQKEEGIFDHVQWVNGKGKHPETLERERRQEQ